MGQPGPRRRAPPNLRGMAHLSATDSRTRDTLAQLPRLLLLAVILGQLAALAPAGPPTWLPALGVAVALVAARPRLRTAAGADLPTLVLAAIFAFHGSAVLARAASPDPTLANEECRGDLPVPEASFSAPPLAAPDRPARASPPLAKNRCAAANRLNSAL